MYTLDYSLEQLDRLMDTTLGPLRIFHVLTEQPLEDRYIVLLDCDPATYTLLLLL